MDYDTLAMCDYKVTAVKQQSRVIPASGPAQALVTPSYLTVITPTDDAILPARTAMDISVALPYVRGCRQEPLGERVIMNDLYGIPLYKPPIGPIDPDLGTGATSVKRVIAETGADPRFVYDQVDKNAKKSRTYDMIYRSNEDRGPSRSLCRVDGCCALGGTQLSSSTEEDPVVHWNMFHIAVVPQFTCQSPGCHAESPR